MPEEVTRRPGESGSALRGRRKQVGAAEAATAKQKKEDAHAPWIKRWEKETGKKIGIGTRGEYQSWMADLRKKRKAAAGAVTAKDAGDALAKSKEE